MHRTHVHWRAVVVGATGIICAHLAHNSLSAATSEKPNFVLFLADDLGWTDLGCFGSDFYETPHIDALAKSGLRLTSGYASCPVCSPTRVGFQTGLNPARLSTTEWFGGPQPQDASVPRFVKRFQKRRFLPAPYVDALPLKEQTIAELFREHGYQTCFAGKWHLGGEGHWPEDQGYHLNFGGHHKGHPPAGYFSPYKMPTLSDGPKGEHLPARLAKESVKFICAPEKAGSTKAASAFPGSSAGLV
ncbi:sulfatase-like hydrolase/transferase [Pirellulales bacterium]|nr:sulfatase-like hydrolase/transferase [Pirellulales bacterium]